MSGISEEIGRNLMETSEEVDRTPSPSSPSLSSTQEPKTKREEGDEDKQPLSPEIKVDDDEDDDDIDVDNDVIETEADTRADIPVASSSSYNESEDVVSNTNEFQATNEENPEISSNTNNVNADSSNLISLVVSNNNDNNNNNHNDNNLTASSTTNPEMIKDNKVTSVASCSFDSEVNNDWNENQMECETSSMNLNDNLIITTATNLTTTTITTTTNNNNNNNSNETDVTSGQSKRTFGRASNTRIKLDELAFNRLDRKELWSKWRKQEDYIDSLEAKIDSISLRNDCNTTKELEERLKQQQIDACRRENTLVMRLTNKEQEVADLLNRIQAMRAELIPSDSRLNSTLLDPALNLMFERMKSEVISSRERVDQMQNELAAWKFTTDSHMGKQLMAKCQALYKENDELGKTIESGRIGKMEGELSLQKNFVEEMKKSQMETDEFLFELDEEVEGLQATILHLRNQLKDVKAESDLRPAAAELIEKPKEVKTS
ncbi:putative uncharacterized protein DDB_G0282133 [Panonychus citri]|uniref:putative uncharacterized protein DDB_G0282133 n=1 Tax=Panonychus citri TaxID=50023 RepID=UPI002307EB66|nr:putative uncharacterized protein DDB_G0282133 [Panonychus citri]